MTQRGPAQNYSPDLFSEETPMDDILTSIRTMVIEEENALTKLKEISDEVGQMVNALGHAEPLKKNTSLSEDHDHVETQVSSDENPEETKQASESMILPLPGTEGLQDAVEDFLTDDPNWKKYSTEPKSDTKFDAEEESHNEDASVPSFLKKQVELSAQDNEDADSFNDDEDQNDQNYHDDGQEYQEYDDEDEHDTVHTSTPDVFTPDASLHDVLNLTTVVHSDGSISEDEDDADSFKTTFSNQVAQQFAGHFTGGLSSAKDNLSDNQILSQAFEIIVAKMTAPMIEKWLEEHGPALFEQIMKKRFQ